MLYNLVKAFDEVMLNYPSSSPSEADGVKK